MKRRKIEDESDARACIAARAASGLSASEWARTEGIDGRSLRAWTNNLQRGTRPAKQVSIARSKAQLVELVPSTRSLARYVVRVGSHTIDVDAHFDESSLRRLLSVLASC